jgi:very-short-patch-repair endonuclease
MRIYRRGMIPGSMKRHRMLAKPEKTAFAKEMRKNPTPWETKIWNKIRQLRLPATAKNGRRGQKVWKRQVVIGGYIVDFYCPRAKVAVELDGKQHNRKLDAIRDERIRQFGVRVLRFTNVDVDKRFWYVIAQIQLVYPSARFAQFPQHSSSSSNKKIGSPCCDDEHGGKVDKSSKAIRPMEMGVHRAMCKTVRVSGKSVRLCLNHPGPVYFEGDTCPACAILDEWKEALPDG